MKKPHVPHIRLWALSLLFPILLGTQVNLQAQIGFGKSELDNSSLGDYVSGITSVMFGPDGRLYFTTYSAGLIKIYTIQRNGSNNYVATDFESLSVVMDIVNHDDDGTVNPAVTKREVTGMTVVGTAQNPVIYVTSSDTRIGAGSGGGDGDVNLDTNSGVITRITWTGSSWETVDLVRGLPRSEENHATNGLEFATINGTDYLIVAQGGHTNGGAPSTNFTYICEYALSGSVLSVNLDMLNAMDIKTDGNGRKYVYDLPTLDDPTRPNVNGIEDSDTPGYDGIDINDPFGGNDGLNMAKLVPGGPVQIFSPGYRNAYDLVLTESGAVYVTDNGANKSWGGFPVNEGTGTVTNDYDPSEPGSSSPAADGEYINNEDHLQLITTDVQNYAFGSYYAGHPNPVRANPSGSGLFTAPNPYGTTGAFFRTQIYDPDGSTPGSTTDPTKALPADWPPVPEANPVEGDWRGPGLSNPEGPADDLITIWGTNTNGIDEYTATNFGGAMKGDLLAGHSSGYLRRVELNPDGSLKKLTSSWQSSLGGNALGVTCNGDNDIFPGTIWIGTLNGKIVVLEPNDYGSCLSPTDPDYDPLADYDGDGYTNQDEEDNGTELCNGSSQPSDFDASAGGSLVSDLNDTDDDNDGIPDAEDPFQLGNPNQDGSDAFNLPVYNELYANMGLGGIYGIGMTGLMNNGEANPNWQNWLDQAGQGPNPDDLFDASGGLVTLQMTSGTALGATNTQAKGFQYGVQVDQSQGMFTVTGRLTGLTGTNQLYEAGSPAVGGELGFFIGDGSQSNYIKFVATADGLLALQENNDTPQPPISIAIAEGDRPNDDIVFFFVIDPSTGEIGLEYSLDGSAPASLGSITAQGNVLAAIQQAGNDLAVGITGTSNTPGVELEGTWDYLNVLPESEPFILRINAGGPAITYQGHLFEEDQYYLNGLSYSNNQAQLPELFKTERTANPPVFDYSIPVPNGTYTVTLYFAELFWDASGGMPGGAGTRIFDVTLEGNLVLDNFDMIADSGSETPIAKIFEATVEDGQVNINFSALTADGGVNQPKVSAIELIGIPSNEPPVAVASATPMSGRAPLQVSFTGNASTDDSAVTSYLWDFKDGSSSSEANPVHTFDQEGTYEVELVVEDAEGLTDTTSITIEVDPPNQAPIAVAGASPTSGEIPLEVSFTGSESTDDSAVVSYLWDFKDGSTSGEADPMHTFTSAGTFDVELTVEDEEGLTHTDTVQIVVSEPPNQAPQAFAAASPVGGPSPLVVSFTGSGSSDDQEVVSYFWDFKDGFTSPLPDPVHTFIEPGVYPVSLTVADSEGLLDSTTVTITVNEPPNDGPLAVISATPIRGGAPLQVTFTGANSYDDKEVVSFSWNFGDGGTSTDVNPVYTYTEAGVYGVTLTVEDEEGLTDTATLSITVEGFENSSPTALISASLERGDAPLDVAFTGSGSTDDSGVTGYFWDFGDGTVSTEPDPVHTFAEPNTYRVQLTVRDFEGLTDSAHVLITAMANYQGEIEASLMLNPVDHVATIRFIDHSGRNRKIAAIYIHDLGGRVIQQFTPDRVYSHGMYQIPVHSLSADLYFISFQMEEGDPVIFKVLVNH